MPKPLPEPLPVSRYVYDRIVQEIEAKIDASELGTQKLIAAAAHLDESAFSHRMTGGKSRFKVEHLGAIADYFKAPTGWPFLPWKDADERDRAWKRRRRRARRTAMSDDGSPFPPVRPHPR